MVEVTDNVIRWPGISSLPTSPSRILEDATAANLGSVVVLGFDADGGEYFASSEADGAQALWHLERARHKLMQVVDRMSGDG
jgi:hypothetical protein